MFINTIPFTIICYSFHCSLNSFCSLDLCELVGDVTMYVHVRVATHCRLRSRDLRQTSLTYLRRLKLNDLLMKGLIGLWHAAIAG